MPDTPDYAPNEELALRRVLTELAQKYYAAIVHSEASNQEAQGPVDMNSFKILLSAEDQRTKLEEEIAAVKTQYSEFLGTEEYGDTYIEKIFLQAYNEAPQHYAEGLQYIFRDD